MLTAKLKAQQRNDFKPQNDDISFSRVSTDPCQQCCEIMEKVRDAATKNLSGKNLEGFLVEVGTQFHTCVSPIPCGMFSQSIFSLLLEHFKKFPVSPTGGLMLAKYV
jgi:exocyst complex component 5